MTSVPDHPKALLAQWGLAARHSLGQNFLVNAAAMARIVELARVGPGEVVLEIGTGLGNLTERLAARAAHVVSVEVDVALCAVARSRLSHLANLTLVEQDFLAGKHAINPEVERVVDEACAGRPLKVVANLPYQISSPAIVNLLERRPQPIELDVMLQEEVVQRLVAAPGTREYGPLTVFTAYWAAVERLLRVSPSDFWPQPQVWSAFVRITPRPPEPPARSYERFCEVVNGLLQSRRKSMGRALQMKWGRQVADAVIESLGMDRLRRPDALAPEEFVRIADAIEAAG